MALSETDLESLKAALLAEREALAAARAGTAGDRAPVELDQQSVGRLSRMDAMQMQAMAKAQETRRRARGTLIEAALRRLGEGEYGYCTRCGEDIPLARLKIDPASPRCVDCA